ncbi:hypothetical protein O3M35_000855 [Rhynocoris fuscipes]|uniref:Uncharacterized protein n=1 Tax=Rhynocoris fuscipes TaxID=488301 RepID=A0AAW1DSD4_9HEMI
MIVKFFCKNYHLYFVVLILFLNLNQINSQTITQELTKMELHAIEAKILEECRIKFSISKSVMDRFLNSNSTIPTSQQFKCMLGCFASSMGFVSQQKVNWDMIKLEQSIYHEEKDDKERALQAVDNCKRIVTEGVDSCEISYQLGRCLQEEYRKGCIGGCNR